MAFVDSVSNFIQSAKSSSVSLLPNNHPSVFSHLCCISSVSFCFLPWSAGDWELMLRDGGVPSLICSFPPSGSELPLSVFLHFALRFWNQTWKTIDLSVNSQMRIPQTHKQSQYCYMNAEFSLKSWPFVSRIVWIYLVYSFGMPQRNKCKLV